MLLSPLRIVVFSSVLLLAACSTAPRNDQPESNPPKATSQPVQKETTPSARTTHEEAKTRAAEISSSKKLPAPPAPAEKKVFCPPEPMPALNAGEYAVWIDSDPEGGIVVVDGKPVGRTPQRIVLNGTTRGFCREDVSIKVRFVAADSDHTSQTVEEILTPLDKIPARVRFTTQGTTRTVP